MFWIPRHSAYWIFGSATAARYRLPATIRNEVFQKDQALTPTENTELENGDFILKNGNTDVLDIQSKNGANLAMVALVGPAMAPLDWSFDRQIQHPLGVTATEPTDSQVDKLTKLVGQLKITGTADYLEKMLDHPAFFVRWRAVQSLGIVHPERVKDALTSLCNDAHPEIKKTAQKLLVSLAK